MKIFITILLVLMGLRSIHRVMSLTSVNSCRDAMESQEQQLKAVEEKCAKLGLDPNQFFMAIGILTGLVDVVFYIAVISCIW